MAAWARSELSSLSGGFHARRRQLRGLRGWTGDEVVSVVGEDGRVVVASGAGPAKAVPELPPVRVMSSRGGGACAVLQTGELRCWGQNQRGALVLAVEAGSPTK